MLQFREIILEASTKQGVKEKLQRKTEVRINNKCTKLTDIDN